MTTVRPQESAASPNSTRSSRAPTVRSPKEWRSVRFNLRYRKQSRDVVVLAPFPEYAVHGTGAAADEDVVPKPLDSASESLNRMTARKRPVADELELFYTEMERCLRAGLSESMSLKLVTPLCKSPFFRGVISGLRYLMERHGMKLGDAMAQFPNAFDEVAVAMVRAGETSGKQDTIFLRLAKRTSSMRTLSRKLMGALVTPGITLFFLVAAMLVMHFFVFPNLESNFKAIRLGSGVLPLPTRVVVGTSSFLRNNPWVWLVPISAFVMAAGSWRKILTAHWFQRLSVRFPFVGGAYRLVIMSRSLDALALLNAEAVPLERCYALAAKVAAQFEYRDYFIAVHAHIVKGRKAYSAFLAERFRIGPEGADIAARMEAAGVIGETSESLRVAATVMQEVADSRVEALPKFIGPVVTVVATVIVGFMVMAVFLPTFQLLLDALKGGAMRGK